MAVEAQLDAPDHAFRGAEEDVLGLLVGGRAPVRPGAPLAVVPGSDAQTIADDQPARAGPPGRLQYERAGEVAAPCRDHHSAGGKPERAGRAIEDGRKNARAVGAREAHPLDAPARSDEGVDLAVREKCVLGDRRESAGKARREWRRHGFDSRLAFAVDHRLDDLSEALDADFSCHLYLLRTLIICRWHAVCRPAHA